MVTDVDPVRVRTTRTGGRAVILASVVRRISARSEDRTTYRATFAVLAAATVSFSLVQSMTIPVIAQIQDHFSTTQATSTWVLTAYLLSASVATPIVGRLGDAVGKEKMLVFSVGALALGSLVAALAPTIEVMIAARVIQGIGGGVLPISFGIIRDEFPEKKVAGAISVTSSLMAVGMGIGIVVAGPLVDYLGYAWLFWLPCAVTGVTALIAVFVVPPSPVRRPGRVSFVSAVLLSGWLVCLLLAVSQGGQWGWSSVIVIALFAGAVLLGLCWALTETRVRVPLVDMRMMRRTAVWTTNLVALLVGMGMYASFGFTPQFNQTPQSAGYGFGASVTESGLLMLPAAVMTFVAGVVASRIADRIGPKAVVAGGSAIACGGLLMQGLWHGERWQMLVANGLAGLGIGLAFACLAALIVGAVPADQTGIASGMNANIRTIGGAIGSAVMAGIVTAHATPEGLPVEAGYTIGFLALAGAFAVATLCALAIPVRSEEELEDALLHDGLNGESR